MNEMDDDYSIYKEESKNLNVNIKYPRDPNYDYFAKLETLDLDKEAEKDLSNNHGFIIKEPQPINKTIKSEWGIFSSKFGRSLQDDTQQHRFSCKNGCTQGAFYAVPDDANFRCPICGTEVKLVGDDFTFFAYIKLKDEYAIIHPTLFIQLESLIGKDNLANIIEPSIEQDSNGNPMSMYDKRIFKKKNARRYKKKTKLDAKYEGIGILGLRDHFQEIIDYFYKGKATKKLVYDHIMANKEKVFIHSIPVYTTQLRIAKVENKRFTFEKTNADFNLLASLAAKINKDNLSVYRNRKYQNQVLWDMQMKLMSLTTEIHNILTGKKGTMRSTISGRTAFSSRIVIVPDPSLRSDEVSLPYYSLVLLLEQIIINILQSSYNITYAESYKIWYYATLRIDQRVLDIINNLIKMDKIHVLINRNPTIFYQSIVWKRVVKCNTDSIVMGLDQFVLTGLTADFDGDVLNVKLLLNKKFDQVCEEVYSPRNAFFIERNYGLTNPDTIPFKDTLINMNAFINMSRKYYDNANIANIKALQAKYKEVM